MEWVYAILAFTLVIATNVIVTTVIADRYKMPKNDDDRVVFISLSTILSGMVTFFYLLMSAANGNNMSLGSSLEMVLYDVAFWVLAMMGFTAVRNFAKVLPAISRGCNAILDKLFNIKNIFVGKARQKIAIELHKDEEIARLKVSLAVLRLQLAQVSPKAIAGDGVKDDSGNVMPGSVVSNQRSSPVKAKRRLRQ